MYTDGLYRVYLFGNKELNFFKIGFSSNVSRRLEDFHHYLPFVLEVFHTEPFKTESSARCLEQKLLKQYFPKYVRGEWFKDIDPFEFMQSCQRLRIPQEVPPIYLKRIYA